MEVGAQDGEFMSLTLHLEKKDFDGLLIEPNPVDYQKLLAKKRTARSINACASPHGITSKVCGLRLIKVSRIERDAFVFNTGV